MADRERIEPYRRDGSNQHRYHHRDERSYSRGSSMEHRRGYGQPQHQEISPSYNRHAQRFESENRKHEEHNPQSILKRRDMDNDRGSRGPSGDYRGSSYGRPAYPREESRSPPRDQWRSSRGSQSPHRHHHHHSPHQHEHHHHVRSSASPVHNGHGSPHRGESPCHRPPFVPIDDPVERRSLIAQLDDLKHRLHYDYTKDNAEINDFRRDKENQIQDILAKKDALVEESHMRITNLKQEIEEEERKAERIRDENVLMQKSHASRVVDLQDQIENSQVRLEQVKREHEEAVRNQIRQQDDEKKALREDYER